MNSYVISMAKVIDKSEKVGFHKGAIDTLLKERAELAKLVNITNQLIQLHAKALKEMGIDLEKEYGEQKEK